jgi:signal transduction histidine kinase
MKTNRRSTVIYGLLLVVWLLVVGWQVEQHHRVQDAAKTGMRNRSKEIANTLSAVIRAMRFHGGILQERLEPVLSELVNGHTNQLVQSSDLISVALLNTTNGIVVSAGEPVDSLNLETLEQGDLAGNIEEGDWAGRTVTFVIAINGAKFDTNEAATVVLPGPPPGFTNNMRGRDFHRPDFHPDGGLMPPPGEFATNSDLAGHDTNFNSPPGFVTPPPEPPSGPRSRNDRRPPWLRWMDEAAYKALMQTRELHGLVVAISTENYHAINQADLWLRFIIAFFAGVSAIGVGLAWRSISKSSDLQIRLIRASELNSHLKEMNLAAAGLAHETRNPLNIIRGMAQMLSKQADSTEELREKSQAIVNQTDKVTAQLNEFINYSRPREVRRTRVALTPAINEVVRTLGFDIEEKKLKVEVVGDPLFIEADDQLLRQVLFNLIINAIQAVDENGSIQILSRKSGAAEAALEVRDNGAGVPPEKRLEIFKPYFTTTQKGTGLGLAVVQQIVLAHGWEIMCLPNEPKGALFRISHLKLA